MNSTRLLLVAATGFAFIGISRADDSTKAILARVAQYQQTSASNPALLASLPYMFIAECENLDKGAINVMSVTLPTSGVFDVEAQDDGGNSERFSFQPHYGKLDQFNLAFPQGTYSLTFQPPKGPSTKLTLSVKTASFPTTPKVSNYTDAQKIDVTKTFAVKWGAFAGAAANDRILFGIDSNDDDEYSFIETGSPAGPVVDGSLKATTTSYTISANSLPPGADLTAQLIFVRADTQSSIPDGYFASGAASLTRVKLHTAGAADKTKPTVKSSVPANNATSVASTATVTITFSEPLRTKRGWNVSFNNLANSYPSLSWKNATTLTIAPPAGGWPKGKKIGVILNPAGTGQLMKDLSGNALAATTISFTVKS